MFDLGRQNSQRLWYWREELKRHLSTPVMEVCFCGATTLEHLLPAQGEALRKRPYANGEKWGACWEYGWFSTEFELPQSCAGERVVLCSGLGGEQCVYMNGQAIGSIDREHHYVTLSRSAQPGERVRLLIESYAGHGERLEHLGPCPPERPAIPPVPDKQCVIAPTMVHVWNEDAYQLHIDVETLCHLLNVLPDKSLRAQRVAKALMDFTYICDFELPAGEERNRSFRAAREALREALGCKNGSTAPLMWLIGQSHIDLAWLWPIEETWHKSVRTFSNQVTLMEEYPEFKFLLCEPALLEMLKKRDPQVWERVKQAARRGQMVPDGAFYVECDVQITSGESIIRQLLWGKQWYRDNLGVESLVAWQPDTFGYSGALPQIFKKMGVPYFATQKLLRADPECERFPYQNFIWEGIDGSEVLALSFFNNNAPMDAEAFTRRWEQDRMQQTDIDTLLYPFGYGDGGGGPTRDMLEASRRLADLEGAPRSRWGGVREFFEDMKQKGVSNRWVGELYLSWHRGTLTSQRKTKALIREAEQAMHDVETWLCMLPQNARTAYAPKLHDLWEQLMLCQFHDVAPGTSIRRVHEWAESTLAQVREGAYTLFVEIISALCGWDEAQEGLVLVNSLPWPQTYRLWDGCHAVTVPACAITNLNDLTPEPLQEGCKAYATQQGIHVENRWLSFDVDNQGCIVNLNDIGTGVALMSLGQKMNDWRLYQNVECCYDAWEMSRDWERCRLDAPIDTAVNLVEATPYTVRILITRRFGASHANQTLTLHSDSRQISFVTTVDWQERHRLLKTHFESNIVCDDAIHEIQFGHVHRPCHKSHAFAADRYESCNQRYSALCESNRGFAVLNTGIFGVSTGRGELALSLLRGPLVPDDTCNRGLHTFTYALMPFAGSFESSGVVRAGYELNQPCRALKGCAASSVQGFVCESDSVILETVKPAENGNGVILRMYESLGGHGEAAVRLPYNAEIIDCGMDERQSVPLCRGSECRVSLSAFEIRTLRVVRTEDE